MIGMDAKLFVKWAKASFHGLAMLILLLPLSAVVQAQDSLAVALQAQSEFLPVREAYRLDGAVTPDGGLRLYWQIKDGYYLYQHTFKVRAMGAAYTDGLDITFPPALAKTDEFFGDVSVYYGEADLLVTLPDSSDTLTLAVTYQGCADAGLCYPPETDYLLVNVVTGRVSAAVSGGTVSASQSVSVAETSSASPELSAPASMSLIIAMGAAFLGGLILNAMPCVFPILSLKVLSFATGDPVEHRRHGIAYLFGVVGSFVLIASVLISLQTAGRWVGWGFQLQSTGFVIGLAYLFTLMGLSLSGLVLLGGSWMNLGAGLAAAPGTRGRQWWLRAPARRRLWVARWVSP